MKINRVRYLKGPNYFSYSPTLLIELDIEELEYQPSDIIPGFNEALMASMPSLLSHTCSPGYTGGFFDRLKRGTWMGHILEHIAIELQNLAGIEVKRGKTIAGENPGIYYVTYSYKEEKSGLCAFNSAVKIVESILSESKPVKIESYVAEIEELYYANKLGPSTEAIYQAALKAEIPVQHIGDDSLLRLGTGSRQKFVQATITSQTSNLAVEHSCDKQMTKDILTNCGLPVPIGMVASTLEEIFLKADLIGYPLVLKPLKGRQGQGVMTNIKNREQLFNIVNCLETEGESYIIERYYQGSDYRLLVVNGQLVAASMRIPPYIIGNGTDTIQELIELENKNPLRGDDHEKPMTKIPLDHSVSCYLEKMNLSLQSIPEKGDIIQVVGNANLSTGGKAIDVTDQVHATIKDIAVSAAKAINLDIAGIDVICPDISKSFNREELAIIEVNAAPGIRMHHFPSEGKKRDVGAAIVNYLFKDRTEAAIPIIAITGTNGKTTTARLVSHFLSEVGRKVGMANSDGVYIGGQCIDEGDCSGPISARKVLANPNVDYAVLETARGGILREGLAFRHCDVGIITNVAEDHLGSDGIVTFEQLVKLKRLIAEVVHESGYCILNAEDSNVAKMSSHSKGKIIYTSLTEQNGLVKEALQEGAVVWYVNDSGWIIYACEGKKERFLLGSDIPITINGTAKHNLANLLQALAAAYSQGVTMDQLRERALCFYPDSELSKGRFNIRELNGRKIIIDYAHNVSGLAAIFDTVKNFAKRRVVSVIAGPGDRKDEDLRKMAELLSKHSDILMLKEDDNLRGREPLEVAKIMKETAINKHMSKKNVLIVPKEPDAYREAWELSKPGDLLLFFYTDFDYVTAFFSKIAKPTLN
ncbi:cyanophycin synthetase [Peribacillus loiseleuriae]|uniref:Cyanophycin synthetase n=1 Tax=Peribacillus loiseleuriae TaxID=1679170 RepID=A0A0K9GR95_9BACI|nr:cyanophycin synthetase [Peribacillus loiseleuriae]KMY49180.1 UDP-N-acetylmuramyl peptide synthase [Peribacillus loiseleuriae]